jgi:hypothetical protein
VTFSTDTSLGATFEVMASDSQVHTNPAITGFDTQSGSAPNWFAIHATGGLCQDDVNATLQMTGSSHNTCYMLTVKSSKGTFTAQTNSGGAANVTQGSPAYADGDTVYLEVTKTCTTSVVEAPTFTISGHL